MLLVYDDQNVLHLRDERGLRWNYDRADAPDLCFDYDYLFYAPPEDEFFELNGESFPLEREQIDSIKEYISLAEPPDVMTLQGQYLGDLKFHIDDSMEEQILNNLNYNGWSEILVVGREGSQDPFRAEARRILEFRDFLMQTFYRIEEEIQATEDVDLLPMEDYINKLPTIPRAEWFSRGDRPIADRLRLLADSDTLDVNDGEKVIGTDKRAV